MIREEGGYIVEGDIFIDDEHLRTQPKWGTHYVVETEQYHTTNLVYAPRVITVSVDSKMPAAYKGSDGYVQQALDRYNAEKLSLTFELVSSGGNINIVNANGSYLASAGFPTASGNPHNQVKVNTRSLNGQPSTTIASVLAHEIGHCIGFRHTDYMDRSISCGGSTSNEGTSTVGAVWIPNTPQTAAQVREAITNGDHSFMLACISSGADRPFTASDKIALNALYPR